MPLNLSKVCRTDFGLWRDQTIGDDLGAEIKSEQGSNGLMGQVEKIRLCDDLDSKGSRQRNRHNGGCGSMVAYRSLDWAAGKRREDTLR